MHVPRSGFFISVWWRAGTEIYSGLFLDDFDFWKYWKNYQINGYAKCFAFCCIFSVTRYYLIITGNRHFPYEFFILFRWMWLFGVLLLLSNNKFFILFYVAITYCYWTTAGTYPNAFCMKVNINFIVQMSISFYQACCVCSNNNEFLIIRYVNPNIIQD
jgi:hypothetical protein